MKIDSSLQTSNSWNQIHTTAREGKTENLKILLDLNIPVDTQDANLWTPLVKQQFFFLKKLNVKFCFIF